MRFTDTAGSVDIGSGISAFIEGLVAMDSTVARAGGLTVIVLLVLLGVLRGRRRARVRRWNGAKVATRREAGRARTRGPPRERRGDEKGTATKETTPDMMAASTRNYHQALEALLRQPGKKTGVRSLRRLLELARVLDQHRAGDLQDLTGFAGEAERLLGFEVHVRPVANSAGVSLRLMHDGELLDEVAGPFRGEIANGVAERARILQRDLAAWLDSLSRLRSAGDVRRTDEPPAAPWPRTADADLTHDPFEAFSSRIPTAIDVSGLRSLDEPPPPAAGSFDAQRGPVLRKRPPTADDGMSVTAPPPSWEPQRPPEEPEPGGHPGSEPPSAAPQRPSLRDLPPRLARAIEEVDGIIEELDVERPASLHAGERFFKADSSERTSLLDRLDRLVFTSLDAAAWTAARGPDPSSAEAAAWFRRHQDQLIELLRHEFGLRPYDPGIGDPFEPTEHIATETVATGDPRRDRTVAGTVRHGYVLEIAGERRFLERPKVTVALFESGSPLADEDAAAVVHPPRGEARAGAHDVLDVPVDSAYPGERDFSITVYARWPATAPLRAWIEVDGRRLAFARADLVAVKGGQATIQLSGCDIPDALGRGDGVLVLEDGGRRQARHPFEVLT